MERTEIVNRIVQRLEVAGYVVGRQKNGVVMFVPPSPGHGSVPAVIDIMLGLIWNDPELLDAVEKTYKKEESDEKAISSDDLNIAGGG